MFAYILLIIVLVCLLVGSKNEQENFVPWNNEVVGKHYITVLRLDQERMKQFFQALVNEDAGKIPTGNLDTFRAQEYITEQAHIFLQRVLDRLNVKANRKFKFLDTQSIKRELSYDKTDYQLVERYTFNIFIQEKNKQNVHAHVLNVSFQVLVKGQKMAITKMHFVTDHFYNRPLVDGENVHDRYFRIKNPFHLHQPFYTTEDRVLFPDNVIDSVLKDTHRDLRTPKYGCFDIGGQQKIDNKVQCDLAAGYWDKPVEYDAECPFFKANKNFVNRLGGLEPNSNSCQMPIGTRRIGYRYISADPAYKPWCYNCKIGADGSPGSIGPCCDEQLDKELYPNLVGPDYAFGSVGGGDALERYQHAQELAERGLHWAAKPTNTRDVTNPSQKQPVFNAIISPGPGKIDLP